MGFSPLRLFRDMQLRPKAGVFLKHMPKNIIGRAKVRFLKTLLGGILAAVSLSRQLTADRWVHLEKVQSELAIKEHMCCLGPIHAMFDKQMLRDGPCFESF